MIGHIFQIILVEPILNFLVFCYNYVHDIGIVIILVTFVIRLILAPSFHKSLKSQRAMALLQPKMDEIKEKHKDNKEEQAKQLMNLYKESGTSPFSSCLPLLIQLPLLIALYQVFNLALRGHDPLGNYLYHFVHNPGTLNPYFLQVIFHSYFNLAQKSVAFGVIAGLTQYWQSRLMLPKHKSTDPTQKAMALQTLYVLPAITVFISMSLPAGLPLYWIASTLFAVAQQYYIMRKTD